MFINFTILDPTVIEPTFKVKFPMAVEISHAEPFDPLRSISDTDITEFLRSKRISSLKESYAVCLVL